MASTITLSELEKTGVVLKDLSSKELSRLHPEGPVSKSEGSPSLPGTPVNSPTQFGEATEVSESEVSEVGEGTEKGFSSDIEAEPPQKKAREVKQEEVNPAKKKSDQPRRRPAAIKQPEQSSHQDIKQGNTHFKQENTQVKQPEQYNQEEVKQENGQVKQENQTCKEEVKQEENTPSQSDDDSIDVDNVMIPYEDNIWQCMPGGFRWKVGQTMESKGLEQWLKFARRQYVAKMKRLNLVEEIVYKKDCSSWKAISITNKFRCYLSILNCNNQ
jgi:hypothetical protein